MKTIQEIPSLIGTLQSNRILRKLQKRKDNQEFRTEAEYNTELKRELVSITERENQPTFNFTPLVTGPAYSDYMNLAMDQISLDLEVVFAEISYMFSKIESHRAFFIKTVKEVESLVNKIERQLKSTEIEASLDTAFNKVYHDSFLDKSKRLSLLHPLSSEFYFDSRENVKITESNLGGINTEVGRMTLPKFSDQNVNISQVNIIETETTVSDFNIQIPGVTSDNLLSTDESLIWSYNIITHRKKDKALLVLEIDMGDKKELNQLRLVPNSAIPVILESIVYDNENREEVVLDIETQVLSETKLFLFPTIIARRLKFKFSQDKTKIIPFDLNSQGITLDDLQRDPNLPISIASISSNVASQINDPNIQNILGVEQNRIENTILLNNYIFSLNSIEAGLSDYNTKGGYVSKPVKIEKPSLIAFELESYYGTVLDVQSQLLMPAGSIECSLFKKDYSVDGVLLKTENFNILPLGQELIENERLFFNKDKVQSFRFLGHKTDGDASGVKVFRNGEELIRGIDWTFPERQTSGNLADDLIQITADATKVQILQTDEQILNGVYYTEYSPRYRLEPENTIYDTGTRYLDSGATLHSLEYFGEEISYSEIFTQIIIRNHTNSGALSPYVSFYRLVAKEESDD